MTIWQVLDIAPTRDEREIRRAYARALKTRQHEDDAGFFETLRQAYDQALHLSRQQDESAEEAPTDADADGPEAGPPTDRPEGDTGSRAEPATMVAEDSPGPTAEELAERALFDTLNAALETLAERLGELARASPDDAVSAWLDLSHHVLLERLDIREQVSEVVADMIARNWPASAPLFPLAECYFSWEVPTSLDNSRLGHALRWLYDHQESTDARLQGLRDAYIQHDPHPEDILARREPSLKRYLRFAGYRGERILMRRYLADVDALGLAVQLSAHVESLDWWRRALTQPMVTKRHFLTLFFLSLPLMIAHDLPDFMRMLSLALVPVGLWHGAELAWHHWRKGRGRLLDEGHPLSALGAPVLLAMGLLTDMVANLTAQPALLWAGTLAVAGSALWGWLLTSTENRLRDMDDGGIMWFGSAMLAVAAALGLSLTSSTLFDFPGQIAVEFTYGMALSIWLLLVAAPMLRIWETHFPALARHPAAPSVARASIVLLGLHLVLRGSADAQWVLGAVDTILVLLWWACRQHRDWQVSPGNYAPYIAVVVYAVTMVFITNGTVELGLDPGVPPHGMAGMLGVALSSSLTHLWRSRRHNRAA